LLVTLPTPVTPGWSAGSGQPVYPVYEWSPGIPVLQEMPTGYGAQSVYISPDSGLGITPVYFAGGYPIDPAVQAAQMFQQRTQEYAALQAQRPYQAVAAQQRYLPQQQFHAPRAGGAALTRPRSSRTLPTTSRPRRNPCSCRRCRQQPPRIRNARILSRISWSLGGLAAFCVPTTALLGPYPESSFWFMPLGIWHFVGAFACFCIAFRGLNARGSSTEQLRDAELNGCQMSSS
jgi:hypothetical protein